MNGLRLTNEGDADVYLGTGVDNDLRCWYVNGGVFQNFINYFLILPSQHC